MPTDTANVLEPFRSYLEVLARVHLDPRLRGKLDPADVVQQALLRAYAAWPELKNPDRPVLLAWLRRILARTLADVVKHYDRDKRAVDLERSLEADLDRSAAGLAGWRPITPRRARRPSATRNCFAWPTRSPPCPSRSARLLC
jgi:DNA-directed RNA polymerase specialized sigma24 family protein